MKIYSEIKEKFNASCVALGTFDGLHNGHVAVICDAINASQKLGVPSIVISVKRSGEKLMCRDDFSDFLEKLGVDILLNLKLEDIKNIQAEEFVNEYLFDILGVKHMSCGYDCRFGKNATGDVALLDSLCHDKGATLSCIEAVKCEGEIVSSTLIREYIKCGDIDKANIMLGHTFGYHGRVIGGSQLARTLKFPTINQLFEKDFIVPKNGVYASKVTIDNKKYFSVTNIGLRPTVENATIPRSETYIMNFTGDLYGKDIRVELFEFIREEQKFLSIEELGNAIKKDVEKTTLVLKEGYCE